MGRLYIFGNGLDLHYGLKTSVDDYVGILKNKNIYNTGLNAYDFLNCYGVIWSSYEKDLSNLYINDICDDYTNAPDYMSDKESDRDYCIYEMSEMLGSCKKAIFDSLNEMVNNAEKVIRTLKKDSYWQFHPGDMIISFNYTTTIEHVADLKSIPILHLHGKIGDNKQFVFGYGTPTQEPLTVYQNEESDYYFMEQENQVNFFYESLQKKYQIEELKIFLSYAKNIDEVVVYGHSLGEVDRQYFSLLDEKLNSPNWTVYYYDNEEDLKIELERMKLIDRAKLLKW